MSEETKKESEETENPKEAKRIRIIAIGMVIGFIIIFFAVLTGIKLLVPDTPEYKTMEYHGFEFRNVSGTWYTEWQAKDKIVSIALRYNPLEVQNVSMVGLIEPNFSKKPIYITFDPLSESDDFKYLALAGAELGESLAKAFEKEIYAACTVNDTETCLDRPIMTCADKNNSVIFLNASGPARIIMNKNCLTLQGEGFELLRAVDKILYIWYNIMPVKLIEKDVAAESTTD